MGKIIKFPGEGQQFNSEIRALKEISDKIDAIIISALNDDSIEQHEMVGLLGHRMGALLKNMENKQTLWKICKNVIKDQADLT